MYAIRSYYEVFPDRIDRGVAIVTRQHTDLGIRAAHVFPVRDLAAENIPCP